jgi:uncharacterized protein
VERRVLIDGDRIRRFAREKKIGAAVAEKDYVLTWLLRGFYHPSSQLKNSFLLKGGTAIRKAFLPGTWRFSEDLDFTVTANGSKDPVQIRNAIGIIFDMLIRECGIAFSMDSFHANAGHIVSDVQFRGPLNYPNRIKLDISLAEKMVLSPEARTVRSDFPDLPDYPILAYSLNEILAEKIRSIMQRGYSRDYYDVWKLLNEEKFDKPKIKALLIKKCELKGIKYEPELFFDKSRILEAKAHWVSSLEYLAKDLPDPDKVISELKDSLAFLQEK